MKYIRIGLFALGLAVSGNASARQQITIPAGHDMHIIIDASQGPLGQRWQIAAWGQRDGVPLPIPGGWTPPGDGGKWPQLIYQEQTSYSGVVTHKELNWPRHNHALLLVFDGWANRNGEHVSFDRIDTSANNHTIIAFDRIQDNKSSKSQLSLR